MVAAGGQVDGLLTSGDDGDIRAGGAEEALREQSNLDFVLDDEDAGSGAVVSSGG